MNTCRSLMKKYGLKGKIKTYVENGMSFDKRPEN